MLFLVLKLFIIIIICCYKVKSSLGQERVGCLAKSTLQKWKSEMLGQGEQGNLLVFCKDLLIQNCLVCELQSLC